MPSHFGFRIILVALSSLEDVAQENGDDGCEKEVWTRAWRVIQDEHPETVLGAVYKSLFKRASSALYEWLSSAPCVRLWLCICHNNDTHAFGKRGAVSLRGKKAVIKDTMFCTILEGMI